MSTTFRLNSTVKALGIGRKYAERSKCMIIFEDGSSTNIEFDGDDDALASEVFECCSRPMAEWLKATSHGEWSFAPLNRYEFFLTLHDDTDAVAFALAWSDRIVTP